MPVRVSVIMPVYNDAAFLEASINSILAQTFTDFELLILDDGSTDGSNEIVARFTDQRIRHFKDSENLGPALRRNQGLNAACGEFIALMDGDDIAPDYRLSVSVAAMEANPEVGILGGQAQLFNELRQLEIWKFPLHHGEICARLFFRGAFSNPSIMLRTSVIRKYHIEFEPTLWLAEDYLFWHEMLKVSQGMNLDTVLVNYRVSPTQLTRSRIDEKRRSVAKVHAKMLEEMGVRIVDSMKHQAVIGEEWIPSNEFFDESTRWLVELIRANQKSQKFPILQFEEEILRFLYFRCRTVPLQAKVVTSSFYRKLLFETGRKNSLRLGMLRARDLLIRLRGVRFKTSCQ